MEDVEGISKIVKASCPSFVELKGMTFSGQGCLLSMENCPWYSEVSEQLIDYPKVVDFGKRLNELLDDYEISCEHEHSCSVLLTHKKFYYDGKWHTWIDFDKFQELYAKWKQDGTPVNALDYSIETPVSVQIYINCRHGLCMAHKNKDLILVMSDERKERQRKNRWMRKWKRMKMLN